MTRFLGIVCLFGVLGVSLMVLAGETPQTGKGKPQLKPLNPEEATPDKGQKPKLNPLDPGEDPLDKGQKPQIKPLDPNELPPGEKKQLKPGDKEGPDEKPEDPKEVMARIAKNMMASEDNLKNKKTGRPTQEVQQKIIDDLDKLINQQENNEQNQGSGSSSSQSSQSSSSKNQSSQNSSQQNASNQNNQPKPEPMGSQNPKNGKQPMPMPEPMGNQKPENGNDQKNQPAQANQAGKTGDPKLVEGIKMGVKTAMPNKNGDLYPNFWPQMPKTKQTEVDTYLKYRSMPEYRELFEQYRSAIVEKK